MHSPTMTFLLRSWCFICVSSVFMLLSWRLNYALPIFQHSKYFITRFSRFLQFATRSKARRAYYIHRRGRGGGATFTLSGPQERYANTRCPDFCSLNFYSRPLQKAVQKPLLRMNSMENKTRFMKSVVHGCQVDHSYLNYDIIHLVRRLVVS